MSHRNASLSRADSFLDRIEHSVVGSGYSSILAMTMRSLALVLVATAPAFAEARFAHVDYATYLGGSLDEHATSIVLDSADNAYVTGTTSSSDFPLTSKAFGTPSQDHPCAFITKLNSTGNRIDWSVCLANLRGDRIALDLMGNVYLMASDSSNISSITKLTPSMEKLVYTRSLGVTAAAMAIDSSGSVYITGAAGREFTPTDGAYQSKLTPRICYSGAGVGMSESPCPDAFVTRLRADGTVAYATYIGGSRPDSASAIAVDAQGNAWITGNTTSADFPVTSNALQTKFHGQITLGPLTFGDAFVAKLDPTGSRLIYSTYLGGSAPDAGLAIAVDSLGSAYVAGGTQSTEFPTTPNAFQRIYGGGGAMPSVGGDAFVAKFSAAGSVVYSTFLGGTQVELARGIALDESGRAYVHTSTNMSVLSAGGSSVLTSEALGDVFARSNQGSVVFAGQTLSHLFFSTPDAVQPKFGGGLYDATIIKTDFAQPALPRIANIVNAAGLRSGTPANYPVFQVAPGEVINIFGVGFDSNTTLLFDGLPAPIIYKQSDQMNAIVPFGVTKPSVEIALRQSGKTIALATMDVFDAVPALFTLNGSGHGQAAILNQDGSVNSANNRAPRGSVISVFLTGAGRMNPPQLDGSLGPLTAPFPVPILGVGSSIGQVLYAGAAPGLVAGVVQVNIQISNDVSPGANVPIMLFIGDFASGLTGDTTVAVR